MSTTVVPDIAKIDFLPYSRTDSHCEVCLPPQLFEAYCQKKIGIVFDMLSEGKKETVSLIGSLIVQCMSVAEVQNFDRVLCFVSAERYRQMEDLYRSLAGNPLVATREQGWHFLPAPVSIEQPAALETYVLDRTLRLHPARAIEA